MMRQAFIEGAQWDYHIAEIDRMEQLTKQDVVDVANKYFGDDYVAVYTSMPSMFRSRKSSDRSGDYRSDETVGICLSILAMRSKKLIQRSWRWTATTASLSSRSGLICTTC